MGTRIATCGDSSVGASPARLLDMTAAADPDLLLHVGDLDDQDDPPARESRMGRLGDIAWTAVTGHHDADAWWAAVFATNRDIADGTRLPANDPGQRVRRGLRRARRRRRSSEGLGPLPHRADDARPGSADVRGADDHPRHARARRGVQQGRLRRRLRRLLRRR
ncbi:MAG: hypothetical protein IT376_16765 [Polyangiaceae bacterium]|nr:hypothetical protein [Polyangiaceae bacterium]